MAWRSSLRLLTSRASGIAAVVVAVTVVGVGLSFWADTPWVAAAAAAGVGAVMLVRIEVVFDSDLLHVRMWPFRGRRVPLADIVEVTARPLHPLREFLGWGYRVRAGKRGYLALGHRRAVEVATDRVRIVVTVTDPDAMAEQLQRLVRRGGPGSGAGTSNLR